MRKTDKLKFIKEANFLSESRYLKSKDCIMEFSVINEARRKVEKGDQNINFSKKDHLVNTMMEKFSVSKEIGEWAYNLSDKYCMWIIYAIEESRGKGWLMGPYANLEDVGNRVQDVLTNLIKVKNRPPFILKDHDLQQAIYLKDRLKYINDWALNPHVATPDLTKMEWHEATAASQAWHKSLEVEGKIQNEQGTIIHKFPDGYYWINTHKSYDESEGNSMGHCGTASCDDMVLISLRNEQEAFITLDYDEARKTIIQFKGKQNKKPIPKYHPYIVWFISDPEKVHFLNTDEGYQPETNFSIWDLNANDFIKVVTLNPDLLPNRLSQDQFNSLPDATKISFFKKAIRLKQRLKGYEFDEVPSDLKLVYIKMAIENKIFDNEFSFDEVPDDFKSDYLAVKLKNSYYVLRDDEYDYLSPIEKKYYLLSIVYNGTRVTPHVYMEMDEKLRHEYLDKLQNHYGKLSVLQHQELDRLNTVYPKIG